MSKAYTAPHFERSAMRIIIYGVGAIGGVLATALAASGTEVIGIARGARLDAIRSGGLTLRTPNGTTHVRFTGVAAPSEIKFYADDVILLTVKSQDSAAALNDLRTAGVTEQAIFCAQNGVANEAMALRLFPNVHGINVMLPAEYRRPDETLLFGTPRRGIFDMGRYPRGTDDADRALAKILDAAGIASFVTDDVMVCKYGKLLVNLGNIVEAALGRGTDAGQITKALRSEGREVLEAAGVSYIDVGGNDPRRSTLLNIVEIDGITRIGSSTSQSLARGAGRIETDYLNGEIALLARLHGLPAPANTFAARLATRLARDGAEPGSVTVEDFARGIGL